MLEAQKLRDELDWLEGEFENLSSMVQGEWSTGDERDADFNRDRERAAAVIDAVRKALAL